MRLLCVLLVALAAVSGSEAQGLPVSTISPLLDTFSKIADGLCNATVASFASSLNQPSAGICVINNFTKSLLSRPNTNNTCLNAVGSADNITILVAAGSKCNVSVGCINSEAGVLSQVLSLVQCLLSGNLGGVISTVLSNVSGTLGKLPVTSGLALLIVQILLTKVTALLCSPTFTVTTTALVLPAGVGIILFGTIAGLLLSPLAVVGVILLVLSPVVMLLVLVVAILVLLLGSILDPLLGFLRKVLVFLLTGLAKTPACQGPEPMNTNLTTLANGLQSLSTVLPNLLTQFITSLTQILPALTAALMGLTSPTSMPNILPLTSILPSPTNMLG